MVYGLDRWIMGKCIIGGSNRTCIGEWHLLIGNIIKFLEKFEIDVDYFKLYYIFTEFLDISLIWHKSL